MSSHIPRGCAALLPALLLLAGCAGPETTPPSSAAPSSATSSPAVSPTPAGGPPPLDELELSPEGLGTLVLGQPVDPELATFDPHGCRTPENEDLFPEDDPVWEAWLPNYPKITTPAGFKAYPFEPHHEQDGTLLWIKVQSPDIRTAEGVGLGSSRDEVTAAYPDAVAVPGVFATAYGIDGTAGRLVFEVADDSESLGVAEGEVWTVRVEPLEWQLQSLSGSDAGGWCAVGV